MGEIERREEEHERRKHDRIARRDLILEIVVILLIGGEIYLGYKAGKDEDILMGKQTAVLNQLNGNAALTAEALKGLQLSSSTQHELDYRVALNVVPDLGNDGLQIMNLGQRRVGVLGRKIGGLLPNFTDKDRAEILTGQVVQVRIPEIYDALKKLAPEGANNAGRSAAVPVEFYLRGDDGSEWVAKYRLKGTIGGNGVMDLRVNLLSCTKRPWPYHP